MFIGITWVELAMSQRRTQISVKSPRSPKSPSPTRSSSIAKSPRDTITTNPKNTPAAILGGEKQGEGHEEGEEEIDPYYKELTEKEMEFGLTFDPEEAYHKMPAAKGGNSHFEVEEGEDPDGKFDGKEMLDPQTKLQLILRKAFEYRMLNSFEAQFVRSQADNLTFACLVLSGISSILLLTNYTSWSAVIAATLTATVTTLTGYNSYMQYTTRYEKHTASVKAFANIQRDVMADLQTLDDDEITDKFNEYSLGLSAAIGNMPLVEQSRMDVHKMKSKGAEGKSEWETYFPNISDIARWNESVENIKSMKDLSIFTDTSDIINLDEEAKEKIGVKRSRMSSGLYMKQLSESLKVNEERKYLGTSGKHNTTY